MSEDRKKTAYTSSDIVKAFLFFGSIFLILFLVIVPPYCKGKVISGDAGIYSGGGTSEYYLSVKDRYTAYYITNPEIIQKLWLNQSQFLDRTDNFDYVIFIGIAITQGTGQRGHDNEIFLLFIQRNKTV
jgi:hypothetical protein